MKEKKDSQKKINKNNKRKLSPKIKEKPGINILVYLLLRILVIASMIGQGLNHNWNNVALCILTLILFTIPNSISRRFHVTFPEPLEIIVYLFIYSAAMLGEIQNFYGIFSHWDTILHTLNGFLCAAIGFSIVDMMNHEQFHINMSPAFAAIVAFSFSMTIGVLWEFCEFTADNYLGKDMQKDKIVSSFQSVKINQEGINNPIKVDDIIKTEIIRENGDNIIIENGYLDIGLYDTMKDLLVNLIGALIFSIIGYLYTKNRDEYRFIELLMLKLNQQSQKVE